jgi:DNA-binding MarR family transcriptional regulator
MARPRIRNLGSPTQFTRDTWARERPDLDASAYLYQIYVMRLGQHIERAFDRICREAFDLNGADVRILIMLKRSRSSHAPKPAELAEFNMVTTGAIAKQLARLELLGLVEKRPQTGEGGGTAVYATESGLEIAEFAMNTLVEGSPLGDLQRVLSKKERDLLASLCEKLLLQLERVA